MGTHVCAYVISGFNILFRIFANPLNTYSLYTRRFALIFSVSDYLSLFYAQVIWCNLRRAIDGTI